MVGEARREDVGGRVAARIDDQHDRTVVTLADLIRAVLRRDRSRRGEHRPCLGGLVERVEPGAEVDLAGRVLLVPADQSQVSGVAMNWTGSGLIFRGVRVCRVNSLA